jgi:hypothetical protein
LESDGKNAMQNPLKEKKGKKNFKSPYIITFIKLDRHLDMEILTSIA